MHRDVKPANLLIDAQERLAVGDFGIARLADDTHMTQTGQVLGTAAYLSPEQALGRPATAASDRYALAVVAYELLTGTRPFAGGPVTAQARQHVEDEPDRATDAAPELPAAIDAVFRRGLAKDPRDRPATAVALVQEIERALGTPTAATARVDQTRAMSPIVPLRRARAPQRRAAAAAPPVPARPAGAAHPGAGARASRPRSPRRPSPPSPRRPPHPLAATPPALAGRARPPPQTSARTGAAPRRGCRSASRPRPSRPWWLRSRWRAVATAPPTAPPRRRPRRRRRPLPSAPKDGAAAASSGGATAAAPPASPPAAVAGNGDTTPSELNNQGYSLQQSGDNEAAVPLLKRSVEGFRSTGTKQDVNYHYAIYNLAVSLIATGDPAAAIPYLQERIADQQRSPRARPQDARPGTGAGQRHDRGCAQD